MMTRPGTAPGGPCLSLLSERAENAADSTEPVSVSFLDIQSTLAFMNDAPAAFGMWMNRWWRPRPAAGGSNLPRNVRWSDPERRRASDASVDPSLDAARHARHRSARRAVMKLIGLAI